MMKFIIVDDDEVNLFITSRLLKDVLKVDASIYQKAGEALRFLKSYDGYETVSVLLDLNMPVISGWDFLDFFSQFDDSLKSLVHIYIVSSSIDPTEKTKALMHPNVISFISKPLTKAFIKEHFCDITT